MSEILALGEYWTFIAIGLLLVATTANVVELWKTSKKRADHHKALLFTALLLGSCGMLFLGRGSEASMQAVHLEGQAIDEDLQIKALEAQLREKEQLVIHTRAELEAAREETAQLKRSKEQATFKKDIQDGHEHMEGFRDQILNRDKNKE